MFDGKTILITGGTGSWGTELVRQILSQANPEQIRIFSRNEPKQVRMKQQFSEDVKSGRLKFIIGDVRDERRLIDAAHGANMLFHLAALKHVPVCEENPEEAVKTNILGTQNAVRAAELNNMETMVLISTDKAVDPLNLYGTTKAVAEKLVIAANLHSTTTRFYCIRGGNVIGTSGSVVPLFKEQILKANRITITNPTMTRFFLSLPEAIGLIFRACEKAVGGEIFVMKMPATTVQELADVMVEKLGDSNTKQVLIGVRPGEKTHEVLVSQYEASRSVDDGNYYIILPWMQIDAIANKYKNAKFPLNGEFSSQNTAKLTKAELIKALSAEGWLDRRTETEFDDMSSNQVLKYAESQGWEAPLKK